MSDGIGEDEKELSAVNESHGVWRCVDCQWEIEADNDEDGNYHCTNDTGEVHCFDLSKCVDYEPADSCSSGDESSDEEPDSEDERFIDHEDISIEGEFDAPIETISLGTILPDMTACYTRLWEAETRESRHNHQRSKAYARDSKPRVCCCFGRDDDVRQHHNESSPHQNHRLG